MRLALMPTLRELREAAKLSREQLASKAGNTVSVVTIRRIEIGTTPGHPLIRKALAEALGKRADEIEWPEGSEGE